MQSTLDIDPEHKVKAHIAASNLADCILVVDDDVANIDLLEAMLPGPGFEILPATSGAEALRQLSQRRPDLILLDLLMPEMSGFEVCKRIHENPEWADIPIIFVSATADKTSIASALEAGGVDYLLKPFNKQELLARVRTHLMLKTSRDHLKRLAKDKEELLGMISHYLQNHLAGMQMSARLLLDRTKSNGDAKMRLMAENIQSSASQMRVFIKALLANSAADRGITISMESVHFGDATTRAINRYEDSARGKELVIRASLPEEDLFIEADPSALDQVLDNLISNAVKFSPPGKEITVTMLRGPDSVECRIQDQGPGFTEVDKTRMFHRYARLSALPTGGEPSTGLGLSITKKLVQAMDGELTCVSAPGEGATFILRFQTSGSAA